MKTEQEIRDKIKELKIEVTNFPRVTTNFIDIVSKNSMETQIEALEWVLQED